MLDGITNFRKHLFDLYVCMGTILHTEEIYIIVIQISLGFVPKGHIAKLLYWSE